MPSNLFTALPPEQFAHLVFGSAVHATNGTYSYLGNVIAPKMLAGFQYVADKHAKPDDVFLVAVNSDKSMQDIMDAKNASPSERAALEDQTTRALKVASPLAFQHPDRLVVAMFYDEDTPQALYDALADVRVKLETLHKWDYGTNPNASIIIGADRFKKTLAFPSADDSKPVCYDLTAKHGQTGVVEVTKLTEVFGKHGAPYIDTAGQLLFPVKHESLNGYTAQPA